MYILEKLNFKISRRSMPPDASQCTLAFAGLLNSELLPPGLLFPMGNTQYNITYLTYTKDVSFLSRKGCTFRIIQRYIF